MFWPTGTMLIVQVWTPIRTQFKLGFSIHNTFPYLIPQQGSMDWRGTKSLLGQEFYCAPLLVPGGTSFLLFHSAQRCNVTQLFVILLIPTTSWMQLRANKFQRKCHNSWSQKFCYATKTKNAKLYQTVIVCWSVPTSLDVLVFIQFDEGLKNPIFFIKTLLEQAGPHFEK